MTMTRRIGLVVLLCAPALAGCGDEAHWGATAASEVRELPILADVEVVEMTREEFAARAADRADGIEDAYLQYMADTYGRLGFFDMDLDLRPVFAGASSDWVGATYSPSSKLITLVGEAPASTVVHEFVHALQDQHFDIAGYDRPETSDSFLARRAVVEGDATLAQYRFLAREDSGGDLDVIDWRSLFDRWREFSVDTLAGSDYPPVFLDYVSFSYPFGLEYSARNLIGITYDTATEVAPLPHAWVLQDELYLTRAPETTSQILDLEINPQPGGYLQVGIDDVPAALSSRLRAIEWDRLGEWYVYLLFFGLDRQAVVDARALAAAWRGDRALFLTDQDSGAGATVWASAWDDGASAAAVADALRLLHGHAPVQGQPEQVGTADDGEIVWIEVRGDTVVAVKNLALDVAPSVVDAAFAGGTATRHRRHPSLPAALERLRRRPDVPGGCGTHPAAFGL